MSVKTQLEDAIEAQEKGWTELAQNRLYNLAVQIFHNSTTKITIHTRRYITYMVEGSHDEHPLVLA